MTEILSGSGTTSELFAEAFDLTITDALDMLTFSVSVSNTVGVKLALSASMEAKVFAGVTCSAVEGYAVETMATMCAAMGLHYNVKLAADNFTARELRTAISEIETAAQSVETYTNSVDKLATMTDVAAARAEITAAVRSSIQDNTQEVLARQQEFAASIGEAGRLRDSLRVKSEGLFAAGTELVMAKNELIAAEQEYARVANAVAASATTLAPVQVHK